MNWKNLGTSLFWASGALCLLAHPHKSEAADTRGIVQVSAVQADSLTSFLNSGTGLLRYDDNTIDVQQAIVRIDQSLTADFQLTADLAYYPDGEQHVGFTQLQLSYQPITEGSIRWKARGGFFYPEMSLENTDIGWLSPYTYTQSSINSWLGEELRIPGLEFSLYNRANPRKNELRWQWVFGVYKGNDPLGTLISWRGFANHDRQSLHNDRVEFAPFPPVIDPDGIFHPSWVEPFHEIDGRAGIYTGLHLSRPRQFDLRYYYYDNLADPLAVNSQRLYAWRTRFHSVAWRYNLSQHTRFITQFMIGDTEMGESLVTADYTSWYVMLHHRIGKHRLSARLESSDVSETDNYAVDPNASDTESITLNWRYNLTKHWQLGVEHHINNNVVQSRAPLGEPVKARQQQSLFVVQYRW